MGGKRLRRAVQHFDPGYAQRGEAEAPPPSDRLCTLVCTLASSNPMYGSKIVLGKSERFPYSALKTVKTGVLQSGFTPRSSRVRERVPGKWIVQGLAYALITQLGAWVVVAPLAFDAGLFFTNTPAPGRMMLATASTHVAYGLSLTLSLKVAGVRVGRT